MTVSVAEQAKLKAIDLVSEFCENGVPDRVLDQVRLEFTTRGNSLTIIERRVPWPAEAGPEWSSLKIAQLRYDPGSNTWSLFCRDRNERWWEYDNIGPTADVSPLLAEIDADPTCIFWG